MKAQILPLFLLSSVALFFCTASADNNFFISDRIDGESIALPEVVTTQPAADELKVFWWNIREGGAWGRQLQQNAIADGNRAAESPLEVNLKTLSKAAGKPDVIALGEFEQDTLDESTLEALERSYPYSRFFPYNSLDTRGIQVFSLYPFESRSEKLDWTPFPGTELEQTVFKNLWKENLSPEADKYYDRVFVDIRIVKNNHLWHVVPAHLLNNWVPLASQLGENRTGLLVLFGNDNPHFFQVKRLMIEKLRPLLQQSQRDHSSVVMVGDFNLPDSIYGVVPRSYRLLLDFFRDIRQGEFTFPASSADNASFHRLAIDHAFYNRETLEVQSARPTFQGSDHYPLEVLFRAAP